MPRPAWGLAVLLAAGSVSPALAQPTPGTPGAGQLSTILPPEPPPLSRTLPPETTLAPAPLPPVLGAPVTPADRQGPDLSTTPVLNNDSTPRPTRGASLGGAITPASMLDSGPTGYQPNPAPTYNPYPAPSNNQYPAPSYNPYPTPGYNPNPNAGYGPYPNPGYGGYSNPGYPPYPNPAYPPPPNLGNIPPTTDPNDFVRTRTVQVDQNYNLPDPRSSAKDEHKTDKFGGELGEKIQNAIGNPTEWFKSDHAFDGFISPVSNPFLFEDPRSLTEIRPIFEIDKLPSNNPDFRGGNTFFIGTQLRLAITDRLSFVVNKLGGESFNPDGPMPGGASFGELWFGPKYTFIRSEATGSLLAGGLQFQVPIGGSASYQNTGTLTLVPYVSYAQSILRDCSFGTINGMAGGGYALSINGERSDYLYLSGHVDWNVMNNNHWFPFLEANWFMYTTNGDRIPGNFEGLDLINFGGHAAGDGLLSGAIGTRYKFTENYQVGVAFDFPIAGPREVLSWGFTLDFIVRY